MSRAIGFVALLVAFGLAGVLAYAATKPDAFQIARSITINASPERIFPLINDLRAFNTWNPFLKKDPGAEVTYGGPAAGIGATHAWKGNGNVGRGSIRITNISVPARIAMDLDMAAPMEAHNKVLFTLEPEDGKTRVTWAMEGQSPYLSKVLTTFISMDRMVGSEFEKGLADLKRRSES